MSRPLLLLAAFLVPAACGGEPAMLQEPASPAATPAGPTQPLVEHDFGTVPHGEQRSADLILPLPDGPGPWTPIGFQRSCTCARHDFVIGSSDGTERVIAGDGRLEPDAIIQPGETLRLRLLIDTREKEAADLPATWSPSQVVLQGPAPRYPRVMLPLRFRFGIESPLELRPAAHLALGELPRPIRYEQSIEIHRRGRAVKFGPPELIEAGPEGVLQHPTDLEVHLDDDGTVAVLRVAVKPADARPNGALRCEIRIPTDLPGEYVLRIPVSGSVVDAVSVEAPRAFSFGRIDFSQPREMRLRIVDHDTSRSADFVVASLIGNDGENLATQFEVSIETIEARPRERIVSLRYLGQLRGSSFRGELLLAKSSSDPPLVRIPFMGFSKP